MLIDRCVVASLAALYAFFPLFGTFSAFAPHPPTAPLVSRGIAIALLIVLLLATLGVTVGALRRRSPTALRRALVANAVATYVGALLGFDPAVGIGLATIVAGAIAAHLTLLAYYREPGVARTIYLAVLVSGLAASLVAIAFVAFKNPVDLYAYNHGRAVATFLNPNEFAAYLLAYLSAACGLAVIKRGTPLGAFATVCSFIGALALTLTFSRWGLVAAFAGILAFALPLRNRRVLVLAFVALAFAVAVNAALWRSHHDPQDTDSRGVAWQAGITTFLHFPLTGVGPLAFERLYPVMRAPDAPGANTPIAFDPHDLALSILAESGLFGFAAILWALIAFFRNLARAAATAPPQRRTLALALGAGIVAILVHSLLNSVSIAFGLLVQFSALALAAAYWGFEPHASTM
ncbi:MAG: hypothetical protein NVSMB64_22210 [Candidatus Velthaea sp.]